MVEEPTLNVNWDKVEKAIDDITHILYNNENTLLEIDLIVNTIWTTTMKDKLAQLALHDILRDLHKEVKEQMKDSKKEKPIKEERAPGVG
jgi:hypothetical protein